MRDLPDDDLFIDGNGVLAERRWIGGQEVVVRYDDVPESDITMVDGIRVTTPIRTLIDIAPDCEPEELERMLRDCLRRGLVTVEEARHRLAQPDMRTRPGALLVGRALELVLG